MQLEANKGKDYRAKGSCVSYPVPENAVTCVLANGNSVDAQNWQQVRISQHFSWKLGHVV